MDVYLTFSNEADYNKVQEDDRIDFADLTSFAPEKSLTLVLNHSNGTKDSIKVNHTYNAGQIEWFKAGSALNLMAAKIAAAKKSGGKELTAKKAAKKKPAARKAAKESVVRKLVKKKVVKKSVKSVAKRKGAKNRKKARR